MSTRASFVTGITDDDIAMDYLLVRLRRSRHEIVEALAFRRDVDRFAASLAAAERTEDELAQIELANERAPRGRHRPGADATGARRCSHRLARQPRLAAL